MLKNIYKYFLISAITFIQYDCATPPKPVTDITREENRDFFEKIPEPTEGYRVLITSDTYIAAQVNFQEMLSREDDPEGDKFICDKLKLYDKVDIMRESVITVNLYPDSGKIMKIRPKSLTFIMEIDNLIFEDIKRWNTFFPVEKTGPSQIDVTYRVVLRKNQSDAEIMKEVKEKVKEETEKQDQAD
ncbi:MAG: hypothetical protein MUC95_03740 [Spirochaetes bacterium]|nr:hypothetical protein [Spirochaetota bacterium]